MAFPRVGVAGLPVEQKANRLFPRRNVPIDAGRFFVPFAFDLFTFRFRRFVVLFLVVIVGRSLVRRSRSERLLALRLGQGRFGQRRLGRRPRGAGPARPVGVGVGVGVWVPCGPALRLPKQSLPRAPHRIGIRPRLHPRAHPRPRPATPFALAVPSALPKVLFAIASAGGVGGVAEDVRNHSVPRIAARPRSRRPLRAPQNHHAHVVRRTVASDSAVLRHREPVPRRFLLRSVRHRSRRFPQALIATDGSGACSWRRGRSAEVSGRRPCGRSSRRLSPRPSDRPSDRP